MSTTRDIAPDRRFRDAMGRFATGVTVITARNGDQVHGMTANGFMSVSLDPQLILVSVGERAKMRPILESSGRYGVNVLSSSQRKLSDHFAGRRLPGFEIEFDDANQTPVIAGALVRISAQIVDTHLAGDHVLFVGEVDHFDLGEGAPLIFHGGGYRALDQEYEWTATWKNPDLQWY